jgi:hypothetical protein
MSEREVTNLIRMFVEQIGLLTLAVLLIVGFIFPVVILILAWSGQL